MGTTYRNSSFDTMTFYGSKVKLPLTDATFRNITLDILDKNQQINDQCLDVSFNVYRMREVCICKAVLTNTKNSFQKSTTQFMQSF